MRYQPALAGLLGTSHRYPLPSSRVAAESGGHPLDLSQGLSGQYCGLYLGLGDHRLEGVRLLACTTVDSPLRGSARSRARKVRARHPTMSRLQRAEGGGHCGLEASDGRRPHVVRNQPERSRPKRALHSHLVGKCERPQGPPPSVRCRRVQPRSPRCRRRRPETRAGRRPAPLLVGVDELDDGAFGGVALAGAELRDAEVAAGSVGVAGGDLVEELLDVVAVG